MPALSDCDWRTTQIMDRTGSAPRICGKNESTAGSRLIKRTLKYREANTYLHQEGSSRSLRPDLHASGWIAFVLVAGRTRKQSHVDTRACFHAQILPSRAF